jgi:hypothetical protein
VSYPDHDRSLHISRFALAAHYSLAEAVARIKLADTVTRDDVSEAIRLMNVATQTVRRACSNAHAAMLSHHTCCFVLLSHVRLSHYCFDLHKIGGDGPEDWLH